MGLFKIIASIIGGLGAFLVGCKLLSDNLEKIANKGIKKLFNKASNNRMLGVGIGFVSTSIVQSSGLTTVIVVGLVNAGVMTLFQAASVIMGANIGTTVTAFIAMLGTIDVASIFLIFTAVGIFMSMISKKEGIKTIGLIFAGLGLIFVGLGLMKDGFKDLQSYGSVGDAINNFLIGLKNPFLLLLIGIIFTTLTQSSSVITAILVTMASNDLLVGGGGNAVLFIILGTNIGSTTTALLSSIGTGANAKRASLIHLLFNTFGTVIFFIVFLVWPTFMDDVIASWIADPGLQIAVFHTFFNVFCTLIFIPFVNVFVAISKKLIKDKGTETTSYLDKRILNVPSLAIESASKEMMRILDKAMETLDKSLEGFYTSDKSTIESIEKSVDEINASGQAVTDYLVKISATENNDHQSEQTVSSMHYAIGDILRVGELSHNVTKYTKRRIKDDLHFSDKVIVELKAFNALLHTLHETAKEVFMTKNDALLEKVDQLEDKIDSTRRRLVNEHIARLNKGECKAESNSVFINLVNNMERIGDHIETLAHGVIIK